MALMLHETDSGFVWWDEALIFAVPIVIAVATVLWLARRSRVDQSEED